MRANPRLKKFFLSEYGAKTLKTESLSGVKMPVERADTKGGGYRWFPLPLVSVGFRWFPLVTVTVGGGYITV